MSSLLPGPGNRLRALLVALGVSVLAIVLAQFAIVPAIFVDPSVLDGPEEASRTAVTLWLSLNFIAMALAGVFYLLVTDRGWEWLDLHLPGLRDILWMVGGVVLSVLLFFVIGLAAMALDLPAADSEIVLFLQDDVTMVLIMMAIVIFLNAPAEEFIFRNIVQKRLYDAFSGLGAVLIASVIFAAVHIPVFVTLAESPIATLVSITVIFGGSIIFGYVYLRTENLLVPIVAHAGINLIQLAILLAQLVLEIDPTTQAAIIGVVAGTL